MTKFKVWWAGLKPTIKYLIVALPLSALFVCALWLPLRVFIYTEYTNPDIRFLLGLLIGIVSGFTAMVIAKRITKFDD